MQQAIVKVVLLLILGSLTGCIMMSNYPTEVKLHGIEFVKANPFEQRFILNIDIKNTSSKSLFVRKLEFNLKINGIFIGKGEQFIWQEVPAFATRQINVLVSTSIWAQLKPIIRTIKDYQEVNYHLSVKLTTGSLFYQKISYINHAATLTPDQLPKDKLDKLRKKIPDTFNL